MNGGKLPEGWVETPLENIVEILDSMRIPVNNKERQKRIEGKDFNKLYPYYGATGEVGKIDDFIFDEELIALGEDGVPFFDGQKNKAYMLYGKTWVNNHAHVLKAIQGLSHNKFLCYFLNQFDYHDYVNGGTRLKLTQANMRKIPVRFAPFSEQKIIAEKLDTLLAQVDSTKARLEQIPQILKRFRQVVLAAIVNGKLSTNTEQWKVYSLKNLCVSISDGDHQAPPKSETGIPFLVISDVNKGKIDLENVSRWVPESYYLALKEIRKPSLNDILYTVTGSFGIPVVVNTTKPFCFQRHIAIIKPNSNLINYRFLLFYLESPQIFKHASDVATGTAQKTVSLSSLRNFELSVPSLKEQAVIVHRVEQLFAYADTIEKQVNNALTRVNNLTQSILAKAFRGELTAQWRAENPSLISGENSATALLERIKAERAASSGKKSSRKKA
ncbi:TPA: restriction endonuclease subunit S [Klebsiella pneumoniae]|uniref:restriction endonuclease subunit S n=1 Tax=Enterobacteriaceae TaxID=543 RepID=UPI000C7A6900|nr:MULTISPECIES: restriction endonuclease subunit S [Klebsiella]EKZ9875896.1 restriction endonuclease subunit S [Klebsiella pneumoniae]ELA0423694.1 restriction endonuclease subunit S [Klebsiella pneumoniae]MBE5277172.1 restriction endonuclease subunit S [Klebsiella pneumoniae]MCE0443712.1 restriction endonuclease subunit S [Klebsiella pneumoniae]MCF0983757.1 restriction endonuclease subunit S [Klebsiella pneumoniae]